MILVGAAVLCIALNLTACGKSNSNSEKEQNRSSSLSSQKTLNVQLLRGKFEQCSGLISVPVVLKNTGTNRTLIDSNNFALRLGGKTYHPYEISGEASDFHINFASNNTYQNTITFNVGKQLSSKQLSAVKLTYLDDQGKEEGAKVAKNNIAQTDIRTNMTGLTTTDLGTYYKNSINYLKMVNKQKARDPKSTPPTLEQRFQDDAYDKLHMWVVIPRTGNIAGKNAVVKVLNATKTDFTLNYSDFELVDHDSNEYQVSPDYRNYSVYLPHGKYTTLVVPFETPLRSSEKPYHVEVRADTSGTNPSGSFMSTKESFNPVETVFSKEVTANTLFSLSADKYPQNFIKWNNQQVNLEKNEITATVQLSDYFNLDNVMANYQVVSTNDDGSKLISSVTKVKPGYVATTDETNITWHVKNLAKAMSYQHVNLQSNGKTILQLK